MEITDIEQLARDEWEKLYGTGIPENLSTKEWIARWAVWEKAFEVCSEIMYSKEDMKNMYISAFTAGAQDNPFSVVEYLEELNKTKNK